MRLTPKETGRETEIEGWLCPFGPGEAHSYFALAQEPPCCLGCLPGDPESRVEVFALRPVAVGAGRIRLAGTLVALEGDAAGWRYQLRNARPAQVRDPHPAQVRDARSAGGTAFGRRRLIAASALACLAVPGPAAAQAPGVTITPDTGRAAIADTATVDIHTHAGRIINARAIAEGLPYRPVAEPMRAGGMAVLCLAITPDGPTHKVMPDGRIHPYRTPAPGELYAYAQQSFARLHGLLAAQSLGLVTDRAGLDAARSTAPGVIVSSEGGDFLEGRVERVDEAYARWQLRHLQLTHYRVNELGDIQTEAPVHGGLTDAGAAVIRRCNRLGIVVDVAHGTFDLVKQAAAVTQKPLVLSHTSLSRAPKPFSRLIAPDHARAVAATGGVIGIWPPAHIFPDMEAFAGGMARMADIVGVDHVGLGTDMGGLVGPSVFPSYRHLPELAASLLARGFAPEDTRKILGGNYRRVFAASLA